MAAPANFFLFINNFTLHSSNTNRGKSNRYSRLGVIFSKGFEGNSVTLSFLTSSTSASNSRGRLSRLERGRVERIEKRASLGVVG